MSSRPPVSRPHGKHHSTFYRFLSQGSWLADEVGRHLFGLLRRWLPEEIVTIVDDTLCIKEGPHIFGEGMHADIARSTYAARTGVRRRVYFAFGHSWVILAVWLPLPWNPNRGFALPVLFRLHRSKKLTPPAQYRKRTELAREALDVLRGWLPDGRCLHVVGDGEYSLRDSGEGPSRGCRVHGTDDHGRRALRPPACALGLARSTAEGGQATAFARADREARTDSVGVRLAESLRPRGGHPRRLVHGALVLGHR
ncbi:MAG: transposase [Planctomycetes bacterium]|nr:transposase [Planctomycetota bacterium]